jgi:hypothetical protein
MTSSINIFDLIDFAHLARVKVRINPHLIWELLVGVIFISTRMRVNMNIIVNTVILYYIILIINNSSN